MSSGLKNINWGIIGCGDVCEVKSGPAFNKVPHSKLVAVMRRNEDKAKDYAQRHCVPKYYTDGAALINDEEVNAIYIATPPSSHEMYTKLALQAGKPVYVEKPVSINAASVQRMIDLQYKYNGKVAVAHYRRNLPLFIKIKSLITDGAIGNVKLIFLKTLQPEKSNVITQKEDNWRIDPQISGGGLFHDLAPHQLDIMYWIFGGPVQTKVTAANQGKLYSAPDCTMVQIEFANSVYFNGAWNYNVAVSAAEESCEIIGDKGKLIFSFFREAAIELTTNHGTEIFTEQYPTHIQQPHIQQVVNYFLNKSDNPCTLEEALVMMGVIDKSVTG